MREAGDRVNSDPSYPQKIWPICRKVPRNLRTSPTDVPFMVVAFRRYVYTGGKLIPKTEEYG